jgi:hypothetical protein
LSKAKSAAAKRRWADPADRAKRLAAMRQAMRSPATRAKSSASRKMLWDDPAFRERMSRRMGYLRPEEEKRIAAEVSAGIKQYQQIADEWLVSKSTITRIAKKFNVQKRLRHRREAFTRNLLTAVNAAETMADMKAILADIVQLIPADC